MSLLPTYTVPRRIVDEASGHGLEDTEEGGWMYASLPRTPKTLKERCAAAVGLFKTSSKFCRYFVRVSIRSGTTSAHILETDAPHEAPLIVYDLGSVVDVAKLSIPAEEAVLVVKPNGEKECIQGQTMLGLNLGEAGVLRLAFSTGTVRDAWATWFSELIVQRQLNNIDAENPFVKTTSVDIPALQSTDKGKKAVTEYTRRFLQSSASRVDELPNKGRLLVGPVEGLGPFQQSYFISGDMKSGVLKIKKPFSVLLSKTVQLPIGSDDVKVVAASRLACDFIVYIKGARAWSFEARDPAERNAWVNYFRLVKGRGRLAQTELESFPYLRRHDDSQFDADDIDVSTMPTVGVVVGGNIHGDDVDEDWVRQKFVTSLGTAIGYDDDNDDIKLPPAPAPAAKTPSVPHPPCATALRALILSKEDADEL